MQVESVIVRQCGSSCVTLVLKLILLKKVRQKAHQMDFPKWSNNGINACQTAFLLFSDGQQIWEVEATVDRDKTQAVRYLPLFFLTDTQTHDEHMSSAACLNALIKYHQIIMH